jgi:hypothetical protein
MAKCSLLLLWWLWLLVYLVGYGGLSGLTGFGCLLTLQGRRRHCLLGCVIHKRFDMSQAEFIKRWCLNNVLRAESSSDADGSAVAACTCATPAGCCDCSGGALEF